MPLCTVLNLEFVTILRMVVAGGALISDRSICASLSPVHDGECVPCACLGDD